jgi:hypothetical protein
VTPSGRAAFDGTWSGTVSQSAWTVPTWTVQLSVPASASKGSYSAPSMGCSGNVSVQSSSGSSMTALAATTSLLNPDCVLLAHVTLTLTAPGQLTMTWMPPAIRTRWVPRCSPAAEPAGITIIRRERWTAARLA